MRVLAFDVETVPDLEDLSYKEFIYLKKRGKRERSDEETLNELAFNPFVARLISFSVALVEDGSLREGRTYYLTSGEEREETVELKDCPVALIPVRSEDLALGEKELLKIFWEEISQADRVVSFNGYAFDAPFVKIRSIVHDIDIDKRLFSREFHTDILFFLSEGARERMYSLDFICRRLGIDSPKDSIDGSQIQETFLSGNYREVAVYNTKDSVALAKLYIKLSRYLEDPTKEPSDKQKKFLGDLIHHSTGMDVEVAHYLVESMSTNGVVDGKNISAVIEVFKFIRHHLR